MNPRGIAFGKGGAWFGSMYFSDFDVRPAGVHLNFNVRKVEVEMDTHCSDSTTSGYIEVRLTPEQMEAVVQAWQRRREVL